MVGEQSGPEYGRGTDLGQDKPHSARMYDYFLGGKTNYAVDREAAETVLRLFPAAEIAARVNRAFMHRAVRDLARLGVRQFIDVGTGIPMSPNLHEVAQSVAPECRVAYVDNDPIVLVYADALLDGTAEGETCCVQADATEPAAVIDAVRSEGIIDFGKPVALSLHALFEYVTDDHEPYRIVRRLMQELPSGSYLSLSHATGDFVPDAWQSVVDVYTQAGASAQVRTRAEVLRFFEGLELIEPGLVVGHRWRPEPGSGPGLVNDAQVSLYVGVARKP
ncbi:SAM-dependent methyltransferase [Streptomyces sp. AC550_RSS872]|uniref:SAM-dependent methyltransferase n=1 Tax=Streptomyces sp. AC550_RSS872 TaxID=2823689 RepID=UPI001C263491|nr:SAM-dependent methyltransferase [Streptomyces sp. AC550_RSS872]